MPKYEKLVMGEMQTNTYLVWDFDTREAVVIDPADAGVEIADEIERLKLVPKYVLVTHGHFDHLLGALDLKLIYKIPVAISSLDEFLLKRQNSTAKHFLKHKVIVPNLDKIDIDLNEIDEIYLGDSKLNIIKTPGHTPGSVCFWSESDDLLFTGDTLFEEGVGETDRKYSNKDELKRSIRLINSLPSETLKLPGHGNEFISQSLWTL